MVDRGPGAVSTSDLRLAASQLRLVLTCRRDLAMPAVLAMAPVLIGVAVELTTGLPTAGGVGRLGQAIASEAGAGTLRYLLVTHLLTRR